MSIPDTGAGTSTHEAVLAAKAADAGAWGDWRWHMRNRITSLAELERLIEVSDDERAAIEQCRGRYRWSITPYYAALMDRYDPQCPIRKQAVPSGTEFLPSDSADVDPVGDRLYRKTNRVVHKYPDRAILLVTRNCPVYCRHCTRKFHTTAFDGTYFESTEGADYGPDFEYIRQHPEIRDVLLTGGDPLSYGDDKVEYILSNLRAIAHVEIIRIGTRFPVLLPQRISDELCEVLDRHHPIWLNTHFNHPDEITVEAANACDRLLRHGVPVGNQTVLLRGVNDTVDVMRKLMTELVRIRVRPYYLYHCDNVTGVSGFATTIEEGRRIVEGLHGYITGFAVPQYVVTTRLGKIPAMREYIRREGGTYVVESYTGEAMTIDAL